MKRPDGKIRYAALDEDEQSRRELARRNGRREASVWVAKAFLSRPEFRGGSIQRWAEGILAGRGQTSPYPLAQRIAERAAANQKEWPAGEAARGPKEESTKGDPL
jgi:hypothetical protein